MLLHARVGWALLGAGLFGLVTFYGSLPHIEDLGSYCGAQPDTFRLADDHWIAFHDPQLVSGLVRYEPANGTTLIVGGCGHGTFPYAFRVKGDHADLREPFRLILDPDGAIDGSVEPIDPPMNTTYGEPIDEAIVGDFEIRGLVLHESWFTVALGLVGAGLALLWARIPAPWSWGPAGGLQFGWLVGLALLKAGVGLGMFLVGAAFVVATTATASVMLVFAARRPRLQAAAWTLFASGMAFVAAAIGFVNAFPGYPDA